MDQVSKEREMIGFVIFGISVLVNIITVTKIREIYR